jgi:hypothetical protein
MDLALLIPKLSLMINHETFDCEKEISTELVQESTLTFLASRKHVLEGFTVSKKCKITSKITQFTRIKSVHTRKILLVKYFFTSKG